MRLRETLHFQRRRLVAEECIDEFLAGGRPRWPGDLGPSPAARFEATLRDFATLARERGFRLVLVREPLRNGMPWIWQDDFDAAFARVAQDFGLRLVDPGPALLEAAAAAGEDGPEMFADAVHPTVEGHAVIARVLAPAVRAALDLE